MKSQFVAVFIFLSLTSQIAFAWGGRGHQALCEAAVFLLKEDGLKSYLQNKPHVMGYLCNIPDTHWRSLGADANKFGSPTHYVDYEVLGLKIKEIPTDYKSIVSTYTGKTNQFKDGANIFSVPEEFGSSWWRADQFYRRAVIAGEAMSKATPPQGPKEEQDEKLPYNQAAFDYLLSLGLMGHFVGDNSQPFHNTTDYDGWASGHGGIHAYFEDTAVSFFEADLSQQVVKKARGLKKASYLTKPNVIEKMRELSEVSVADIKKILQLDPVRKPSTLKVEKGMSLKTVAERADGKVGYEKFNKIIIEDLARGALLLAKIWDESYEKAGRPKLAAHKSYKFPHTPEFVMPDYFDTSPAPTKTK